MLNDLRVVILADLRNHLPELHSAIPTVSGSLASPDVLIFFYTDCIDYLLQLVIGAGKNSIFRPPTIVGGALSIALVCTSFIQPYIP